MNTPNSSDNTGSSFDAISQAIRQMSETPRSGVKMCHDQGKNAIYLSKDRRYIVTETPCGTITREPYNPD